MMHIMDAVIITLAVLITFTSWTMIGFSIFVLLMDNYEFKYDRLLSCFFWPLLLADWAVDKFSGENHEP